MKVKVIDKQDFIDNYSEADCNPGELYDINSDIADFFARDGKSITIRKIQFLHDDACVIVFYDEGIKPKEQAAPVSRFADLDM